MSSDTKSYNGYIVVNWKDDDLRFRQTRPGKSDRSPFEVPVKVSFEVIVPEFDIPEISQTLEIPEVQVKQAASELVDYEDEELLFDPEEVLYFPYSRVKTKIENLEDEPEWKELNNEEKIRWFRGLLGQEYGEQNREEMVELLESKLEDYKNGDNSE